MRTDQESDYNEEDLFENESDKHSDDASGSSSSNRRRRKRIKVRKRVRLKRKSNPKKKIRKVLEAIAWTLIIIAFISTLVILISELNLNEKNRKKRSEGKSAKTTLTLT